MAVKALFLSRTDVPPLAPDAPVDAIARWLAREIELRGHVQHQTAVYGVLSRFGPEFIYTETVRDERGGDPALRDWLFFLQLAIRQRHLLHPEILRAFKKLTGNNINWGKDCREWRLVKGAKLNLPTGTDENNPHRSIPPGWLAEGTQLPYLHGHLPGSFAGRLPGMLSSRVSATSNAVSTAENPFGL